MKICGIVSEFNPFHNGHKFLIQKTKERFCDAVICVMSGEFVQRGEYASCDKYLRANAAIENGADLVLSIPFPWSSATAELFARGAIGILDSLGCVDFLAFGSESGDISKLKDAGKVIRGISEEDIAAVQRKNSNLSFARARQLLASERAGEEISDILSSPNDILAIEYLKAIDYLKSSVSPIAVKREHASHDGTVSSESISSSSHIRELAANGKMSEALSYMPNGSKYFVDGFRQIDKKSYFNFLCGSILSQNSKILSELAENGGGFEYVLYREAMNAESFDGLFDSLRAKHLTDAKLRRALLFTALGVSKKSFNALPAFTEVLAANEIGKEILSSVRKECKITILSKPGNISKASDIAKEQYNCQRRAELIFRKFIK